MTRPRPKRRAAPIPDGGRFRNRAVDSTPGQASGFGPAFGAPRRFGAAQEARLVAGAFGGGDDRSGGGDAILRDLRQSRQPVALRHLPRSTPRSTYDLRGGRRGRSLGAGAGQGVPRPLSCVVRGLSGAGGVY